MTSTILAFCLSFAKHFHLVQHVLALIRVFFSGILQWVYGATDQRRLLYARRVQWRLHPRAVRAERIHRSERSPSLHRLLMWSQAVQLNSSFRCDVRRHSAVPVLRRLHVHAVLRRRPSVSELRLSVEPGLSWCVRALSGRVWCVSPVSAASTVSAQEIQASFILQLGTLRGRMQSCARSERFRCWLEDPFSVSTLHFRTTPGRAAPPTIRTAAPSSRKSRGISVDHYDKRQIKVSRELLGSR